MEQIDLFAIPIYKFKFEQHQQYREAYLSYIKRREALINNSRRQTLMFTHPNLHKEIAFQSFKDFATECVAKAMDDLGYVPSFEFTSMWGTHQQDGGFHHSHIHSNAFLAGVYYLEGNDKTPGTSFKNVQQYFNVINPAVSGKPLKHKINHTLTFEEGTLYVFPGWLEHFTSTNNVNVTNSFRSILSFNVMPVGKTNTDEFDRYNFQSVQDADMISFKYERITGN